MSGRSRPFYSKADFQQQMLDLANAHEIVWEPEFRKPTCAGCDKEMPDKMWHVWLNAGIFRKELHLCWRCGERYGLKRDGNGKLIK